MFKSSGSGQTADIYSGNHLSCIFEPASALLPSFFDIEEDGSKREKSYKITVSCLVGQIIKFIFDDLKVKEHLLISAGGEPAAEDYLDLALKVPDGVL